MTVSADGSFWLASTEGAHARPPLGVGDATDAYDVCVVGGGIVGVTTALLLARDGARVALLEADRICAGATGLTTAKVSSAHGLVYDTLRSKFGPHGARTYGTANEDAIAWMADLVRAESIDCDWRAKDAVIYTCDPDRRAAVEDEHSAALEAGLRAELTDTTELPFAIAAAMKVSGQAEFHPRRYVLALADLAEAAGAVVHEHTRVTGVDDGDPCTVHTEHGELTAARVVIATHYPILDRGLFFARVSPMRSYCIGVRAGGPLPEAMYYSVDEPSRSTRLTPLGGGEELLIVGGEGHKTGQDDERTGTRYGALEAWAREHFGVEDVPYRWSTQDGMAPDGVPYVGALHPGTDRVWVATALRKWGMTNGTIAARILAARIGGREDPYGGFFDSNRFNVRPSAMTLVEENLNVAKRFVGDRLHRDPDAETLAPGEGAIVALDGERVAAYRDEDGALHAVSPHCTHLGCELRFNADETSWDCPCHGSRFSVGGEVLEGPAVHGLTVREATPPA